MGSFLKCVRKTVKGLWRDILLVLGMRMVIVAMVYRQGSYPLTAKSSCLDAVGV